MMKSKNNHNYLIGTAITAGILGTLTSLLGYKKNKSNQNKRFANQFLADRNGLNLRMVLGGVVGGLVGMSTALLLAPKSGNELIRDLKKMFYHPRKKRFLFDRFEQKERMYREMPDSLRASKKQKRSSKQSQAGHRKRSTSRKATAAHSHKKDQVHIFHHHPHEKAAVTHP